MYVAVLYSKVCSLFCIFLPSQSEVDFGIAHVDCIYNCSCHLMTDIYCIFSVSYSFCNQIATMSFFSVLGWLGIACAHLA
jgi:hypothetical protein